MRHEFIPKCLYEEDFGQRRLLRFICDAPGGDRLLFKVVARKWNKVAAGAIALPTQATAELLTSHELKMIPECLHSPYMAMNDSQLLAERDGDRRSLDEKRAWVAERKQQFGLIEALVTDARLPFTYDPESAGTVLREHSEATGVSVQMLRRLLHKYAWYGLEENALLKRYEDRGRTGEVAREYKSKTGRPNATQVLGMGPELAGVNVTARDKEIFELAIKKYYVRQDLSHRETYERMLDEWYTRSNQHGRFLISAAKVPTFEAFYKHAQEIVRRNQWEKVKAGHKDGQEMGPSRGNDRDISGRVGRVFDADGTPFNKELTVVSFNRESGEKHHLNIGKGTLIVIYDRDSKKAVGWHFYTGEENWKEGYRLALFCALTSKREHLKYLGIDDEDAFPDDENIKPQFFYADGGPGASLAAIDALERIRISTFVGPPDTPYWKATVEGGVGRSQHAQSRKPGGYKRTNRARDKERKRIAKLTAVDSAWQTERDIVLELIKYNKALSKRHLLTYEMKLAGVPPSSNDIFSWSVQNMGDANQRVLNEAVVYMALLTRDKRQVTDDGISFLKNQYRSTRLLEERVLRGKSFIAEFAYHPNRPHEIYWITPEGTLDRLVRDDASVKAHGKMSFDEIELYELKLNAEAVAALAASKAPKKKKSTVAGSQLQNLREAAGLGNKKVRGKPTANEDGVRKITAAVTRAESSYDKPEAHAPHLTVRRPAPPALPPGAGAERATEPERKPEPTGRGPAREDAGAGAKPAGARQSAVDLFAQMWKQKAP